ncbi:hypothetical protein Tco_0989948 [Tanacetum coccineum]|uniref:Uncharacterized protein n=1 Tax=Tanacetum coccineum TaxID=301880 RepID=A0ABQ5EVS0_9ASTR
MRRFRIARVEIDVCDVGLSMTGTVSPFGLTVQVAHFPSSSLSIWLIEAVFSEAIEFPADSGIGEIIFSLGESRNHLMPFQASFGVGGFIEIPCSLVSGEFPISHIMVTRGYVVSEQHELPSSVGVDFQAQLDDGRMYSGHLEAKRLP